MAGCSNRYCEIREPIGMATSGRCHCLEPLGQENELIIKQKLFRLRQLERHAIPALRAVWKYWSDINTSDPNAEGHDTLEMIREAIEAIGGDA